MTEEMKNNIESKVEKEKNKLAETGNVHEYAQEPRKDEGHEHKKEEIKEEKKEQPETEKVKKGPQKETEKKKEEVMARGASIHASKKHCIYICNFIKNKTIERAIQDLELVTKFKKAVPFKGEIPHRKGMASGRYPIKVAKLFIKILKNLRGNVLANNLDLDKAQVTFASGNWASRPLRKEGRRAKRAHVLLKAREVEIT